MWGNWETEKGVWVLKQKGLDEMELEDVLGVTWTLED